MKKIFTLAAAVLASAVMMAEVQTEVFDQTGAGSNTTITKTATVLPGTYDAGAGGGNIKDYSPENKGVKLRTQSAKVTVAEVEYGYAMITVNSGYAVRSITIEGTSNGSNAIDMFGVFADVDVENLATSLAEGNKLAAKVTFPNKNTTYVSSGKLTFDATSNVLFQFAGSGDSQMRAIITVEYERTATCLDPTIAWNVEPANGIVGAADFAASVNVPEGQTITWESSVPAVATVENGTIHYAGFGITTITAKYTYVGDDYCNTEASISKDILVPITYTAAGANDSIWYFQDAVPAKSPDNGLTYGSATNGNGLYGVKLNSDGYAWFVKPAVEGTLRIGAYYKSGNPGAYEVNVFACDAEGVKAGEEALGSLSISHAGAVSETIEVAAEVTGLRLERKTSQEGILYFVEFRADGGTTAIDNTNAEIKAVKVIRNGQLLIEKNGVLYNAQGAVVK